MPYTVLLDGRGFGGIDVLMCSEGGSESRTVTRESCSKARFRSSVGVDDMPDCVRTPSFGIEADSEGLGICLLATSRSRSIPKPFTPEPTREAIRACSSASEHQKTSQWIICYSKVGRRVPLWISGPNPPPPKKGRVVSDSRPCSVERFPDF